MSDIIDIKSALPPPPQSNTPGGGAPVITINKKEAAMLAVIQLMMLLHTKIVNIDSKIATTQSDMTTGMTGVMQKFADAAQAQRKKNKAQQESIKSKNSFLEGLGIFIGVVSICAAGAIGSITAAGISAAMFVTTEAMQNPINKLVANIAKAIAPNNENAQKWISGILKIAIVVAITVGGGKISAVGDSMMGKALTKKTGEEVIAGSAGSQVATTSTEAVARNMLLVQSLMIANPLADITSALLENCGVSKEKASLIGGVIACVVNLAIIFASGRALYKSGSVLNLAKRANVLLLSRGALITTSLLLFVSGGIGLSKSLNEYDLADSQQKYGMLAAFLKTATTTNDNILDVLKNVADRTSSMSKMFAGIIRLIGSVVTVIQDSAIQELR